MSYSNTFQDYLRDIPMEIGRKFYPPPLINLPTLTLPEPLRDMQYTFEAESRARQQFDEANKIISEPKPELSQKNTVNGVTSSESLSSSNASITNEVLLPCAAPPAKTAPSRPPPPAHKPVCYAEFEGGGTVFDELEWRSIDDKLALSQVLGNISLETSKPNVNSTIVANNEQKPLPLTNGSKPVAMPAIPPYPVLDFGSKAKSEEPSVMLNLAREINTAVYVNPIHPVSAKEMSPTVGNESPLRVRLLTKGYRQNLVDIALERIPRERLPYVEYYMKGMSILEKRGVAATKTVTFLLDSNLSDKQAVVQRAKTAEQLVGMGFSAEEVFTALLASQGDRVKALDALLGAR